MKRNPAAIDKTDNYLEPFREKLEKGQQNSKEFRHLCGSHESDNF